jgi:hypothetical protein
MGDGCSSTNILPLPRNNQPCYFPTKKLKKVQNIANPGCEVREVKVRNIANLKVKVRKKPYFDFEVTKSSKLES